MPTSICRQERGKTQLQHEQVGHGSDEMGTADVLLCPHSKCRHSIVSTSICRHGHGMAQLWQEQARAWTQAVLLCLH